MATASGRPVEFRPAFSSIRVRIVAALLAVAGAVLASLVFLVVQSQRIAAVQTLLTEGYIPLALEVDQIESDHSRIANDVDRLMREEKRPTRGVMSIANASAERLRDSTAQARIHCRQALQMGQSSEEHAVLTKVNVHLDRIEQIVVRYQAAAEAFVRVAESGDREAMLARGDPLRAEGKVLGNEIDALSQLVDGRIERVSREIEARRQRDTVVAFGLTAMAIAMSVMLVVAVLVALQPLDRLTQEVQRAAAGDYTGRLQVRGRDEVAILARQFDTMVQAIDVRDRTLLQRADQIDRVKRYLTSVLDTLTDGLVVVEDGEVTLANPAGERLWGVGAGSRAPEALSRLAASAGHHEWRDHDVQHEVRVMPFGGNGAVVIAVDVTEQRAAEERLARSERLALIGQMLAQITHEVRNPLNALSLNAEMLADELAELDPERRTEAWDLLRTISEEIGRLTEVTAHYLQLARRPRARLEPEDLAGVLEDIGRLVRAELEQAGVEMTLQCDELAPQLADGNQLRQALLNVVRNAVESGARHLTLRLRATDPVRIELTDDGCGMVPDEVERSLDPFFSTKATGTGLGLAITRQVLEDHGGAVRVSSEKGRGTTVVFELPARSAARTAEVTT